MKVQGQNWDCFTATIPIWKDKKVERSFFFFKSSINYSFWLRAFKNQMGSTVQDTCWARDHHTKLTSKCTGYLQTNGGSKQFHCCKGSFQQEADQETSQADLIDRRRPVIEFLPQTSISLLSQSLLHRNSYRRTSLKKPEKDLHFKGVSESRWKNYTCDSPEKKTALFSQEELLTNLGRRRGRRLGWQGDQCLIALWIFIDE